MKKFKQQWIHGLRLSWRIFLLCLLLSVTYQCGAIAMSLLEGLVVVEPLREGIQGIGVLLGILLFPFVVAFFADNVGIKTQVHDFEITKHMDERMRERRQAEEDTASHASEGELK
jgi:hypothetical protein